jgi:hypothetical protein
MKSLRIAFLLSAIGAIALMGCGQEGTTGPNTSFRSSARTPSNFEKVSLNTELVFCVDVSDSTSASELAVLVNGLLACASDDQLIPTGGSVSLGLVAYGDTSVSVLTALVPVTAETLTNEIDPAFEGLLADRLVGGSEADLSSALGSALDLLGDSGLANRHIVVVGDGRAVAPTNVEALCQSLAADGIMISALAIDAAPAGLALLSGCADASGGNIVALGADDPAALADACAATLGFAVQANLVLEPTEATAPKDTEIEILATLFRGLNPELNPIEGVELTLAIAAGPNSGETDSTLTDAAGQSSFTLLGDGGPGIDEIVISADVTEATEPLQAMSSITWTNTPPVCDAGAAQEIVFEGEPVVFALDGSASADADSSDVLSYLWSIECEAGGFDDASSATPQLTLDASCGCGEHVVALSVSDGFDTVSCETAVTLLDGTTPVLVAREEPVVLWPPNHKMWIITPDMCIESVQDACDIELVSVSSDEAVNARGDGNSKPDIVMDCDGSVQLRAERAGGGNGRVYTLLYRVVDEAGNEATVECRVQVPHDQGGGADLDEDEAAYELASDCE